MPVVTRRQQVQAQSTPSSHSAAQHKALSGVLNFRDVAEADPSKVKPGLIFRSATLANATPEDCRFGYAVSRRELLLIAFVADALWTFCTFAP